MNAPAPIRLRAPDEDLRALAKQVLGVLPDEIDGNVLANIAGALIVAYSSDRKEAMLLLRVAASHVIHNAHPEEDGQ